MKLQVTKYLSIDLTEPNELIELISDEDMIDFAQSLSCHEQVIKHVAEQIIHGCTDGGYHGGMTLTSSKPSTALQSAIRDISINSSDIASKEIKELQKALALAEKSKDDYMNKYYDLYHGRV